MSQNDGTPVQMSGGKCRRSVVRMNVVRINVGGRQYCCSRDTVLRAPGGSRLRGAVEAVDAFVQEWFASGGGGRQRLDDAMKLHGAMLDDAEFDKLAAEFRCLRRFDSVYLEKKADLQEFGMKASPCNFDARA